MLIGKIYEKYQIIGNLQMHQLRVAGVAWLICDHLKVQVDTKNIVTACLLHDMGNIVKFKFDLFPENLEPKGLVYWKNVQAEFVEKYGRDDHIATQQIVKELGVSVRVGEIIKAFGFAKVKETFELDDWGTKVAVYSDHRASPTGVLPLHERLVEARKRYVDMSKKYDAVGFDRLVGYWERIEKQIFEATDITPDFVTQERVEEYLGKLGKFEVELKGGK